jgi:hypothetical protein
MVLALAAGVGGVRCGGASTHAGPDAGPAATGALRVGWRLVDAVTTATLSCDTLGIEQAEVAIGGAPRDMDCTKTSTLVTGLLPGRYPVVVSMLIGDVSVGESDGNAIIVGGVQSTYTATISFNRANIEQSTLRMSWLVNGEPASTGCAALNGASVHILTQEGSRDSFDITVPCTDGAAAVMMLDPGTYALIYDLYDPNGVHIATATLDAVSLQSGEDTDAPEINFENVVVHAGAILGKWTVNGAAASTTACARACATEVVFKTVNGPMTITSSVVAACEAGQAKLTGLLPASYSVRFDLFDPRVGGTLNGTTAHSLVVMPRSTTTVAGDLTYTATTCH